MYKHLPFWATKNRLHNFKWLGAFYARKIKLYALNILQTNNMMPAIVCNENAINYFATFPIKNWNNNNN